MPPRSIRGSREQGQLCKGNGQGFFLVPDDLVTRQIERNSYSVSEKKKRKEEEDPEAWTQSSRVPDFFLVRSDDE